MPETFSESDDRQAQEEIEVRLAEFNEATNRRHIALSESKEILEYYVLAWSPMLAADKLGALVIVLNQLASVVTELHIQTDVSVKNAEDMQSLLNDSQLITFPSAELVATGASRWESWSIVARNSLATDRAHQKQGIPIVYNTARLPTIRQSQLQQAIDSYAEILAQVLAEVENGDQEALLTLIPDLLSAESNQSEQFQITRAGLLAAGMEANEVTQLYAGASAYDLQIIGLYVALVANLHDINDSEAKEQTRIQAEGSLQAVDLYRQAIDSAPSAGGAVSLAPLVVVSSVSLPDRVIAEQAFDLRVKVINIGSATASNVSIHISSADLIPVGQAISLGEIAGSSELTSSISLQADEAGSAFVRVDVLTEGIVKDSTLILIDVADERQDLAEEISSRLPALALIAVPATCLIIVAALAAVLGVIAVRRRLPARFIWLGALAVALVLVSILVVAILFWQTRSIQEWMTSEATPSTDRLSPPTSTSLPVPAIPAEETAIPTFTQSPTATPSLPTNTPTPFSCPGAPPQQVRVGDRAYVCTAYDRLAMRAQPQRSSAEIARLEPGTHITIVDGPTCGESWSWWEIQTDSGTVGWVAEGGDEVDPYFICPVR